MTWSQYGIEADSTANIENNVLKGTGGPEGYGISSCQGSEIDGTQIIANTVTNFAVGIDIEAASGNFVTVSSNIVKHNKDGIDLVTGTIQLNGNVIESNTVGIRITDDGSISTLTGNQISSNRWGIYLDSFSAYRSSGVADATLTANQNNITGNSAAGLLDDQNSSVDVEKNWWGKKMVPMSVPRPVTVTRYWLLILPWSTSATGQPRQMR